jgi:hypothetical protein
MILIWGVKDIWVSLLQLEPLIRWCTHTDGSRMSIKEFLLSLCPPPTKTSKPPPPYYNKIPPREYTNLETASLLCKKSTKHREARHDKFLVTHLITGFYESGLTFAIARDSHRVDCRHLPPYKTWSKVSLDLKLMLSLLFTKRVTGPGAAPTNPHWARAVG